MMEAGAQGLTNEFFLWDPVWGNLQDSLNKVIIMTNSFVLDDAESTDTNYIGSERRKHTRYEVEDHILVRLKSQTKEGFGQLLDISEGGLSLYYYINPDKSGDYSELGIFPLDNDCTIKDIPMSMVVDKELNDGSKMLRRQSVRFGNLTPKQKVKLDYLLKNYTLGNA